MTNPVRLAAIAAASAMLATSAPAPDPSALPPLGIVWFAGGGGSSHGMMQAGWTPDYALNHNATALWMHQVNHPDCVHLCDDATAVLPQSIEPGRRVKWFWASPDCTHFSVARGSAPKSPRIRGLAWCIAEWAEQRRPDVIFVENVKEFTTWGPLDDAGQPIKERSGETFREWLARLESAGYVVEWKVLCAADYGAPTTRRRLFIMARCDGEAIVWPERTHAPRKEAAALGLMPYASAASIIDWSERCPSIFMSAAEAKGEGLRVKRPLVKATLSRVAKGIERYVIGSGDPFIIRTDMQSAKFAGVNSAGEPLRTVTGGGGFAAVMPSIVPVTHVGERRTPSIDEPLPTITCANRGELALSSACLVPSYGEAPGQAPRSGSVEAPYPTVVANGNGGHLVAASLARQFGRSVGSDALEPVGATTAGGGGKTQLVAATLGRQFGSNVSGADISDPAPTLMGEGGGGKTQLIAANLTSYYGSTAAVGSDMNDPARTVTGHDRFGLTTAFMEQANLGMVGHDAAEPVSTITGRGTQQRLIEARLQAMGAAPDSRRRAVLRFLWDHFGEPTEAEWADPVATLSGRLRFGLVILSGQVWEIADIGMRMLKVRELFSAQGFPTDYIIDRDPWGRPITGTAATLMVGNSVPPPFAKALAEANLGPPPGCDVERLAA